MDSALQALLSFQFVLLCLGIASLTYVVRLAVEFFILDNPKMPGNRTSKLWREFLLPVSPVVIGVLIGVCVKEGIYPPGIVTGAARVNLGLVAGLLSGLVYRVISGTLKAKIPPVATVTTVTTIDPTNKEQPVSSVTTVDANPEKLDQLSSEVAKTIVKDAQEKEESQNSAQTDLNTAQIETNRADIQELKAAKDDVKK